MNAESQEYVEYRIARARESLRDAQLLIDSGSLHSAVNRLYYACFYIVSALLLTQGLSSSKHTGVRSLFIKHWVNADAMSKENGRFFNRLFETRQKSDYKDLVTFEREDVERWFDEAEAFVARICEEIDRQLETGRQEGNSCSGSNNL